MTIAKERIQQKTLVIRRADHDVMQAIWHYQCMTALQVTKLLFSVNSLTWVQTKLKRMADAGYLVRSQIPVKLVNGRPPLYYGLGERGLAHLAMYGVDVPEQARPYRVRHYSDPFISHLLAVNEVLIAGRRLCQQYPTVKLAKVLHQQDFEREPVPVRRPGGSETKVKLDGFLDFEVHTAQPYRAPLCLEVDRGSERRKRWREKVRNLVYFMRGAYQVRFDRKAITIGVVATSNRNRLIALITWTREELTELKATPEEVAAFRFATYPLDWWTPEPQRPTPEELFLTPRWYPAFDSKPVALLRGIEP
jgi:hypothetical protein